VAKLSKEHIVTIRVLNQRGESKCSIARTLGVTEGAVRYHLRRQASGAEDGRGKALQLEALGLAEATRQWSEAQQATLPDDRPPSVESLHAWLQLEHGYDGSYKSVRKFVRRHSPVPKRRPFRRVETPPGAQSQSDWAEFRGIDIGDHVARGVDGLLAGDRVLRDGGDHTVRDADVGDRVVPGLGIDHTSVEDHQVMVLGMCGGGDRPEDAENGGGHREPDSREHDDLLLAGWTGPGRTVGLVRIRRVAALGDPCDPPG
jgi:hypothetical protein